MKDKKRTFILNAAEKLFTRFGTKKTGVDEIAKLAHVAKGTLYNYFGSKEGIILGLINEKMSKFEKALDQSVAGIYDPVEKIKATICERFKFIFNNPDMADIMLNNQEDGNSEALINSLDNKEKTIITKILDEAYKKGIIPDMDMLNITNALQYLIKGLELSLKNRIGTIKFETIEQEINQFLSLIFKGISKNKETSA